VAFRAVRFWGLAEAAPVRISKFGFENWPPKTVRTFMARAFYSLVVWVVSPERASTRLNQLSGGLRAPSKDPRAITSLCEEAERKHAEF
jgi:hypothetical protein